MPNELIPLEEYKEQEFVGKVVHSRQEVNERFGRTQFQWVLKIKPYDLDLSASKTGLLHEWIPESTSPRSKKFFFYERLVKGVPAAREWTRYQDLEGKDFVFVRHLRTRQEGRTRDDEREMLLIVREAAPADVAAAQQRLEERIGRSVVPETAAATEVSEADRNRIAEIVFGMTDLREQLRAVRQSELPTDVKQAVLEQPGEYLP